MIVFHKIQVGRNILITKGTMAEVTAELEWMRMVTMKPAMSRSSSVAKGGT